MSCSQGGASASALALLLVLLLLRRRRSAWLAVLPLIALPIVAIPTLASADEASDIALRAHGFHQQYCAEVAAGATTDSLVAMREVVPVLTRLSQVYDETQATFLLYWRALLLTCTGQEARAVDDLRAFLGQPTNQAAFPSLWTDAERRLRRLETGAVAGAVGLAPSEVPRVSVGIGGLFEFAAADGDRFRYGGGSLDVTVVSPRVVGGAFFARVVGSEVARTVTGAAVEPAKRSLLPVLGGGVVARFGDAVRPRFLLGIQVGMGNANSHTRGALVGVATQAAVEIQLGQAPVALRPGIELGSLGRFFDLRAGLQVVLGR